MSVCDQSTCSERIIDLEVRALADLLVESIDFDSDEMTQGDIVSMRVMVRNQGQAEATFISVRCQNDQQLMSVETIPVLAPGELGSVTCDWQIPDDATVIRFSAVGDRGLEIPEGDESNNIMEKLVGIEEKKVADKTSSDTGLSSTTVWTGSIGLLLAVIALFAYLTPAKIKKIE